MQSVNDRFEENEKNRRLEEKKSNDEKQCTSVIEDVPCLPSPRDSPGSASTRAITSDEQALREYARESIVSVKMKPNRPVSNTNG